MYNEGSGSASSQQSAAPEERSLKEDIMQEVISLIKSCDVSIGLHNQPFNDFASSHKSHHICDTDGNISLEGHTYEDGESPDGMRKEFATTYDTRVTRANYTIFSHEGEGGEAIETIGLNQKIEDFGYELFVLQKILIKLAQVDTRDQNIGDVSERVSLKIAEIIDQRKNELQPLVNEIKNILSVLDDKVLSLGLEEYESLGYDVPIHAEIKGVLRDIIYSLSDHPGSFEDFGSYNLLLDQLASELISKYFDQTGVEQKSTHLKMLIGRLKALAQQYIDRENLIKEGGLIVDFGGTTLRNAFLVVAPDGTIVAPLQYRHKVRKYDKDLWPEIPSDHVIISYTNKEGDAVANNLPENITPEQLGAIQKFETEFGLPRGSFGEQYKMEDAVVENINIINQSIKELIDLLPGSLGHIDELHITTEPDIEKLKNKMGIEILDGYGSDYSHKYDEAIRALINYNKPTEDLGGNRRIGQAIFSKHTSLGEIQIFAYEYSGSWHLSIRIQETLSDNEKPEEDNGQSNGVDWEDLKNKWASGNF